MASSPYLGGNLCRERAGLTWFEPLEPLAGVARLVMTTRIGGMSRAPWDSLNLGYHVDDVSERVRMNRRAVQSALCGDGLPLLDPVVGEQVHGAHAEKVGSLHAGARWESQERSLVATDALVTRTPRLPLVTMVADCLSIALVDGEQRVAAAVHAGWRGLADGVVEAALTTMTTTWDTDPADVTAWIGPAIGPCCYEVGAEVAERFPAAVTEDHGALHLDLRRAAQQRLSAAGLIGENVMGLDLCTSCHPDLFFSHRRATREGNAVTGRQALILWLDPTAEAIRL